MVRIILLATMQAISMVGMKAYLSYLVAEHFGCSGIVAIFTCAVVMSHHALYNVPREMRRATKHTAELFSYMGEGAIFLYVGLDTIDPVTWQV
jgi:NhaP-type Na+/H+ or K+/H+ antiporter